MEQELIKSPLSIYVVADNNYKYDIVEEYKTNTDSTVEFCEHYSNLSLYDIKEILRSKKIDILCFDSSNFTTSNNHYENFEFFEKIRNLATETNTAIIFISMKTISLKVLEITDIYGESTGDIYPKIKVIKNRFGSLT